MSLTTPAAITALPNSITPGLTTGLEDHLEAVYSYLKDLAGLVNAEITTASSRLQTASPSGVVSAYAGSAAPTGWLMCSGQLVGRVTYPDLFTAIGTSYGVGDGSTTFGIPDLRGRVPVGRDATQTEFDLLGESGGAKTHLIDTTEIPIHSHEVNLVTGEDNHNHNFSTRGDASTAVHSHNEVNTSSTGGTGKTANGTTTTSSDAHSHPVVGTTASVGGGLAHNNLQPYRVLNYIIKT